MHWLQGASWDGPAGDITLLTAGTSVLKKLLGKGYKHWGKLEEMVKDGGIKLK